jgi:hypothetical protein
LPDGSDQRLRVSDVPWSHLVTPQFHDIIWPQIKPFLVAALARDELGRYDIDDLLQEILLGHVRLWVSYDRERHEFEMAVVTQIVRHPQVSECKVWAGGGKNMKSWLGEFTREIEAYARAEGCRYLTGGGRIGWTRAIPGWRQVGIEIAKEL